MVSFPPCKVNLGLDVIAKRPDGYHDIDTCFYPIPLCDVLEVLPAKETVFHSSGAAIPGDQSDNLCLRAYRVLENEFKLPPVHIHLHKIIPTGAGLGGGSSDAAHCLRLLNRVFNIGLSVPDLRRYAALLGSDCAFFITDGPMIGKGRGEILEPIPMSLSGYYFILMNPGIHVPTAEAYSGVNPSMPEVGIADILARPIEQWKHLLKNDFENTVFAKHPQILELKNGLYAAGALYASMSGSGSSVFGIFSQPPSDLSNEKFIIWQGALS